MRRGLTRQNLKTFMRYSELSKEAQAFAFEHYAQDKAIEAYAAALPGASDVSGTEEEGRIFDACGYVFNEHGERTTPSGNLPRRFLVTVSVIAYEEGTTFDYGSSCVECHLTPRSDCIYAVGRRGAESLKWHATRSLDLWSD